MTPPDAFEAPSLDGLRVTVPGPRTVVKADVVARIEKLRTELGEITELQPGQPVAAGDEVLIDVVGFSGGRVLPFTAASRKKLPLTPDPELPGFTENLVGMEVGGKRRIRLQLPPSWPEIPQRLAAAELDVELLAARRIKRAPVMDPAFLEKLGGGTLDEVGQRVARQIEQELRQEAEGRAVKEIIGKLTARVGYKVPPADIDAEIEARWREVEGALLAARGVPEGMQGEALAAWKSKPRLREEVAQQLKEARVLESIAEREGVEVDEDRLMEEAAHVLASRGMTVDQAWEQMGKEPELRAQLIQQTRQYKTVELVMSRAKARVSDNVWGI